MKLSQISLALINPRLELVNEIQRCNQGPCQNYAKEQWVTPIEALISQVADLIKLNLNFEFLNSFPLLRGWGGGGQKGKSTISHLLSSLVVNSPTPSTNSQKGHSIAYLGYRRFFLACDEEFRRPQADTSSET